MRILDKYIALHVAGGVLLALAVLLSLTAAASFVDELDSVGRGRYGIGSAIAFVLLTLPRHAFDLFPFLLKVPRMDPRYSSVMLLIMAVTIFVDPIFAIMFGVIAANIVNAAQLESLELDSLISTPLLDSTFSAEAADNFAARTGLVSFRGSFTVSSSRKLIALIGTDIRDHDVVIFGLSNATHVDDSAAHLLAQVIDRAKQTRTEIVVFGINDRIRGPLFAFDVLDRIPDDRIVATEKEARDLAWSLLQRRGA